MKRQASFPPMAPPPKRTDSVAAGTISGSTVPIGAWAKVPSALLSSTAQLSLQRTNLGFPSPVLLARKTALPLTHRSGSAGIFCLDLPQEKARPRNTPPPLVQKARPVKALPVSALVAVPKASFELQRRIWLHLAQLADPPLQLALEDAPQSHSRGSVQLASLPVRGRQVAVWPLACGLQE